MTLLLGIALATATVQAALIDNFDPPNPLVTATQSGSAPGPVVTPGGPTGNYLRLMDVDSGSQNNRVAYDRAVDGGVSNSLEATYDFRINPSGNPGDGYSILLLPTATYGNAGAGAGFTAEEPNVGGAFGVGFDLYPGLNNVSLHWNGAQVAEVPVPTGDINLDASVFHRAEVTAQHVAGGSNVTVTLTPDVYGVPGTPVTVFSNQFVAGMTPYDYRAQFSARSGGARLDVDLDNISSGVAPGAQPANTFVDFDGVNTQYKAYTHNTAVHAAVLNDAGSDGNFLRLIHNNVNDERNSLPIDRAADGGVSNSFSGTFDFRADGGPNPADGFSMLLIPTATYGDNGAGASATTWIANKPNVSDIFGIGFSFYQAAAGVNDVSAHWDGAQIANNRLNPAVLDLDAAVFHRANVTMQHVTGGTNLNLTITPDVNGTPGAPVTVFNNLFVPGMVPYDYRMEFAARSGGANMDVDLDNVQSGTAPIPGGTATVQDFDGGGSQYKAYTYYGPRHASIEDVGGNNVLRLLHSVNSESNGVAFDRTAAGLYGTIEADWDFSLLAGADGGAFGLINTGNYGTSGQGPYLEEEPNVAQMFTIGFDVYDNIHDVSLHWNGAELAQVGSYDYRGAGLKHAHAIIDYVPGGANVSMEIDGTPIFTNQFMAGMVPYEGRLGFGGRTGGVNTTFELDNINVQFLNPIALPTDPFHWKGFTGNYPDNTKWTNDVLPTGNDDAFIELGICNSSNLNVAGTGSLTVSDMGMLNNSGVLRVGASGTAGTMNQSGGQVTSSSDLYVADAGSSGSTYTMTGGTLTVSGMHTVVGRGGVGHFIQDGNSTVNLRRLFVSEFGGSDGSTYTLHDGTLNINNSDDWGIQVGRTDDGTFNQYGGTVTVDARVHLGNSAGAVGTYNMTDGSLTLGSYLVLGSSGTGIFNQSGGTVTQTGTRVILGDQVDSEGTYNLSGGTLNAVALDLADKAGTTGTFNLSGTGVLNSPGQVNVGKTGEGTFIQTGGTVNAGARLHLANAAGSIGRYELHDGQINLTGSHLVVGASGSGTFVQTGGTITQTAGAMYVGDQGSSDGTYVISGGALNVTALRRGGHAGNTTTFRVIGSDAAINIANEYNLNSADVTVAFDLNSGGISTVNIGSYGNLDGTLQMGIHGGAALWDEPTHTLLSAAGSTLNNDFATKQESIFTTGKVNADKDYVATLNSVFFLGATDTNCGSLGFPLTDAGYVDVTLVDDSQPIELLLTASAGPGMAIDDLIGYMAGAGLPAEASTYPGYDIRMLFAPRPGEDLLHFGWDLRGFNAGAGISGLVANVPEPATWTLLALGLGGLWLFVRRRRRS